MIGNKLFQNKMSDTLSYFVYEFWLLAEIQKNGVI